MPMSECAESATRFVDNDGNDTVWLAAKRFAQVAIASNGPIDGRQFVEEP